MEKQAWVGERIVRGYMCKVDWDHELGSALGGNRIYPSAKNCIEDRGCINECGMVEVEVRLRRVVRRGRFDSPKQSGKPRTKPRR